MIASVLDWLPARLFKVVSRASCLVARQLLECFVGCCVVLSSH